MSLGLSQQELETLSSFGSSPEERIKNVYGIIDISGKPGPDLSQMIDNVARSLQRKMVELILANNKRITEQLKKTGVNITL